MSSWLSRLADRRRRPATDRHETQQLREQLEEQKRRAARVNKRLLDRELENGFSLAIERAFKGEGA